MQTKLEDVIEESQDLYQHLRFYFECEPNPESKFIILKLNSLIKDLIRIQTIKVLMSQN